MPSSSGSPSAKGDGGGIQVRPLDPTEWEAARALAVHPDQEHLVASVADSLRDATRYPGSLPFGVFAGSALVGFMMGQPLEGSGFLLWDFLIDRHHQGRGFGKAAVAGAVDVARTLGARTVSVAYDPDNPVAGSLYRSVGFAETGTLNDDGEREMLLRVG